LRLKALQCHLCSLRTDCGAFSRPPAVISGDRVTRYSFGVGILETFSRRVVMLAYTCALERVGCFLGAMNPSKWLSPVGLCVSKVGGGAWFSMEKGLLVG